MALKNVFFLGTFHKFWLADMYSEASNMQKLILHYERAKSHGNNRMNDEV